MDAYKFLVVFLIAGALRLQQSLAKVYNIEQARLRIHRNSSDGVRFCIAHCLDLVDTTFDGNQKVALKTEKCKFNIESGLVAGKCVQKFYPNPKSDKKVMCYVDNIHNNHSRFDLLKLLQSGLCTHVQLGQFHTFHDKNSSFTFDHELTKSYHNDLRSAAKFNVKVLVHIGDLFADHMGHEKFSGAVSTDDKRNYFVQALTGFINLYNFDGIAINWLGPTCPNLAPGCIGGRASDKGNYVKVLQDFRGAFKPGMVLAIMVPGMKEFTAGYDFPKIFEIVDFFQLYTYDYIYHVLPIVGYCSPMTRLKLIMEFMKPYASKLVLGIRSRVEVYKLNNRKENVIGSRQTGQGYVTSFDQICKRVNGNKNSNFSFESFCAEPFNKLASKRVCNPLNDTTTNFTKDAVMGNFASSDTRWYCYEDYATLSKKVELVNQYEAAGMFVVGVGYDDVNNTCGCGDFGIIRMTAELMRANDGCSTVSCV